MAYHSEELLGRNQVSLTVLEPPLLSVSPILGCLHVPDLSSRDQPWRSTSRQPGTLPPHEPPMSHNTSPMINGSSSWYDCHSRHSPFAALNGIEFDYYLHYHIRHHRIAYQSRRLASSNPTTSIATCHPPHTDTRPASSRCRVEGPNNCHKLKRRRWSQLTRELFLRHSHCLTQPISTSGTWTETRQDRRD